MKTIIHPLAAILLAWSAGASETWSTSPAEAMQQAAAQNKGVMLEFTGSDWCGACIMQKKQALSLPEIQTAISRSFIPVELDYPRKKQQDAQTKTSLETYKKSYGITAFPTLVFADAQGRPVHTVVGYANPAQVMQDTKKAAEALNTQQSLTNNLAEKLTDQQRRDTLASALSISRLWQNWKNWTRRTLPEFSPNCTGTICSMPRNWNGPIRSGRKTSTFWRIKILMKRFPSWTAT